MLWGMGVRTTAVEWAIPDVTPETSLCNLRANHSPDVITTHYSLHKFTQAKIMPIVYKEDSVAIPCKVSSPLLIRSNLTPLFAALFTLSWC